MSDVTVPYTRESLVEAPGGTVGDFIALMKPRVMSLVVFTALVGLVVAPGDLHPALAVIALIAIAVGAGASGALNMWYDADIDRIMRRTRGRPVPMERVTPGEALAFGLTLSVGAVTVLGFATNYFAAALLAFSLSIDDFVISNFNSGTTVTFPLYVYGVSLRGVPVQVNVLATMLFALIAISVSLVLWQQRRAEKMASVRPEQEGTSMPMPPAPPASAGAPA